MTGQTILDYMELLGRELELQTSESDVVRGLLALNIAQDHFEAMSVSQGHTHGTQTGTVTTTADTESTTWPTGLIRLDALWFIDPVTSRPTYELDRLDDVGGHVPRTPSLLYSLGVANTLTSTGAPWSYWTDGTSIYWNPLPDATHTVRWYGAQHQTDITAGGTFLYGDMVAMPLAAFAVQLLRRGLDDPIGDYAALAQDSFGSVLQALRKVQRQRAPSRQYRYYHET